MTPNKTTPIHLISSHIKTFYFVSQSELFWLDNITLVLYKILLIYVDSKYTISKPPGGPGL